MRRAFLVALVAPGVVAVATPAFAEDIIYRRGRSDRNNLQCSDNDPAPQGGDNRVKGDKSDQCAKL
jgi:hypothetical protein